MNPEIKNSKIISEANYILNELGLYNVLKKYGKTFVTGSYFLQLMTWRDLDIYIDFSNMKDEHFFKLGYDLSALLKPYRMSYRNELIEKTPNLPKGLYWGIYTNSIDSDKWKIDIWAVDSKQFNQFKLEIKELNSQIDNVKRTYIMDIKSSICNHSQYRRQLYSVDIYNAVINENVKSIGEFKTWLQKSKGLIL